MDQLRKAWTLGLGATLLVGSIHQAITAGQPDPAGDAIGCTVSGADVTISWDVVFIAPIQGWVIARDGQPIVELESSAMGYLDREVPAGEHTYEVTAINFDGSSIRIGSCAIIAGDFGIQCALLPDGAVVISWQLLIDIAVSGFTVTRNDEVIANLPPNVFEFQDTSPAPGLNRYGVEAEVPGAHFVVGACTIRPEAGLICFAEGPLVHLDWSRIPLPTSPWSHFAVLRDGAVIAETRETGYTDSPGPGQHAYAVALDFNSAGASNDVIGSCTVTVEGDGPPAPEDLACAVAIPDPIPLPGGILPGVLVSLSWKNPSPYDLILVARNGMPIARLPGTAKSFLDHPPAFQRRLVYEVRGVVANTPGRSAICEVEIGHPILPPPADFQCRVDDQTPGSISGVILTWVNLIDYAELVLGRDGSEIAKLPGDAMFYRDPGPPPGTAVYSIHGVGPDGAVSEEVFCTLQNGGPPPVRDLACFAQGGTAVLGWVNPVLYDRIVVHGANTGIGFTLPGDATRFEESGLAPGVHSYAVSGIVGDLASAPRVCRVIIEGLPPADLLFFSTSLVTPGPGDGLNAPAGTGEVTCLERSSEGIQGWSFGVKSDPALLVPLAVNLEDTATSRLNDGAGPTFLSVNIFPDGIAMAAIVDEEDTEDTLPPPDFAHALAHIRYGSGPLAAPGDVHAVEYSEGLGDPPVAVIFVVRGFEVRPATLGGSVVLGPGEAKYLRGDSNGDGIFDISDPVHTLGYLFLGSAPPPCLEAADANATREINIADAVYGLQHLFGESGPPPPPPFPECGPGPVSLGCGAQGC